MGFGGKTSLIGCKIGALNRLPASFFVSIAYDCWAFRRLGVRLDRAHRRDRVLALSRRRHARRCRCCRRRDWPPAFRGRAARCISARRSPTSRFARCKVGDVVLISGRDVHRPRRRSRASDEARSARRPSRRRPLSLRSGRREGRARRVARHRRRPTTSIREEPYQADILKRYGVRVVIGKGGMGAKTLAGLKESGAVYLNAIGGAAQFYARCIERVADVSLLQFGTPEAMWHLDVRDFPAIVTMDAHGNSLHQEVEEASGQKLARWLRPRNTRMTRRRSSHGRGIRGTRGTRSDPGRGIRGTRGTRSELAAEYAEHAERGRTRAAEYAEHAERGRTLAAEYADHAERGLTLAAEYAEHAERGGPWPRNTRTTRNEVGPWPRITRNTRRTSGPGRGLRGTRGVTSDPGRGIRGACGVTSGSPAHSLRPRNTEMTRNAEG